jgi:predicted ATP-binding protein involved in virulence
MSEETEKYKQAWKKFQDKMTSLRKRRLGVLENISKKFDQQQIAKIKKKIG